MARKQIVIAVDFDGTVVKHSYPEIGEDIGAGRVLRKLVDHGHKIVLNTMRCDKELDAAVKWFEEQKVELYGINENPTQKEWTSSPKVFAHLYIDDCGINIPICYDKDGNRYVDWLRVENILVSMNLIPEYVTKQELDREGDFKSKSK